MALSCERTEARQGILQAAAELFGRHGFEGASLREIVRQAGVNLSAVNYYFGTKEQLYQEVLRQVVAESLPMQQWTRELTERQIHSAAEVSEILYRAIRNLFLNYVGRNRSQWYAKLLNRALLESDPRVEAAFLEIEQSAGAVLGRVLPGLIADEKLAEIDFWLVSVFAQIHHYLITQNLVIRTFKRAAYDEAFLNQVASYIARNSVQSLGLPVSHVGESHDSP